MTEEKKQIVTSLRVNADTWKQAKIEAIKHDLNLTELVDEALKEWIKKKQKNEWVE